MPVSRRCLQAAMSSRALSAVIVGFSVCVNCFAGNLLENPDFEIDNSWWAIYASPGTSFEHLPYGWNNSSGSLELSAAIVNGNGCQVTVVQCVNSPAKVVDASIEALPLSSPGEGIFVINLWTFASQDCDFNTMTSITPLAPAAPLVQNSWVQFGLHEHPTPAGSASAMLEIVVSTGSSTGADYVIDHANFSSGAIFESGFDPTPITFADGHAL